MTTSASILLFIEYPQAKLFDYDFLTARAPSASVRCGMSRDIQGACRASTQNENGIPRKSPGYVSLLHSSSTPGYFGPVANMGIHTRSRWSPRTHRRPR